MRDLFILMIDDDQDDRFFAKKYFEREFGDWRSIMHEAESGEEGLRVLHGDGIKTPYSVVLLDIHMPVMDGFEVLSQIRQKTHLGEIPVVILSSTIHPLIKNRAYQEGANLCIQKPNNIDDYHHVFERIKTLISQNQLGRDN